MSIVAASVRHVDADSDCCDAYTYLHWDSVQRRCSWVLWRRHDESNALQAWTQTDEVKVQSNVTSSSVPRDLMRLLHQWNVVGRMVICKETDDVERQNDCERICDDVSGMSMKTKLLRYLTACHGCGVGWPGSIVGPALRATWLLSRIRMSCDVTSGVAGSGDVELRRLYWWHLGALSCCTAETRLNLKRYALAVSSYSRLNVWFGLRNAVFAQRSAVLWTLNRKHFHAFKFA